MSKKDSGFKFDVVGYGELEGKPGHITSVLLSLGQGLMRKVPVSEAERLRSAGKLRFPK